MKKDFGKETTAAYHSLSNTKTVVLHAYCCIMKLHHTYMPPSHLHCGVPVNVWQQAQTEALRVGGIGESVDRQWGLWSMEGLPDTLVQLIVGYRAPEGWLRVGHWLQICSTGATVSYMPTTVCMLPKCSINLISIMAKLISIQDIIYSVITILAIVLTKIGSKKPSQLLNYLLNVMVCRSAI